MKPLKSLLFLLVLLAAISVKAQCIWYVGTTASAGTVQFYAAIDSSNMPATWSWDFGDGTTSTDLQPVHTYASSNTYHYCFHYSGANCTQDTCGNVNVDLCDFNPQITSSQNGLTVSYGVSNAPAGSTYYWTIWTGVSNPATFSTSANPVVTYPTWDTYAIAVSVTTPNSCTDDGSTYITLNNPCQAYFSTSAINATDVQFYGWPVDSMNPSTFAYVWNFGDGGTASIPAPLHSYPASGTYTACLVVNGANCTDTICQQVNAATPPPQNQYLFGAIKKNGTAACLTTVYLISEDTAGHLIAADITWTPEDSAGQGCTGYYHFIAPEGVYYVKAALDSSDADYNNYLPTYYGDVLNWGNATPINLTASFVTADINLIAGVNPGGPGFVGGWVSQGAGLSAATDHHQRSVGDPLPNIQINLLTDNDVPVASTHTDANGRYTFGNLALGAYKVYAEEINKVPYALNVTLTGNNPSQDNVNVTVNSNSAVTGLEDFHDIHLDGISPNPVSDRATVSISLKENSKVQMTLTDIDGRLLQNRLLELNAGSNQIVLNLDEEPTGIYHLSLTNNASKKIVRVVKIR